MEQLRLKDNLTAFIHFSEFNEESIRKSLEELLEKNINCLITNGLFRGPSSEPAAYDEAFFETLHNFSSLCREYGITYLLEDYFMFPTGSGCGAFSDPENQELAKQFIDERHLDITGPRKDVYLPVDTLMRTIYSGQRKNFEKIDFAGRKKLAIVAIRIGEDKKLVDHSACLLDEFEENGYVHWDVPEGHWRVFVLYTTYESSGRPGYMNLLSKRSVELELRMVHQPIYEHMKDELGKTWLGFFYDETEVGNDGGEVDFDFQMLPGKREKDIRNADVYPWSEEMSAELEKRDLKWKEHLPYLFYDGQDETAFFRYTYMDAVTWLVRENYNGVIYPYLHERGILYMGHVLEDGGSHARLGCGPGHYFRLQYYQDYAGIDIIAGQLRPGCDRTISWYGMPHDDGELYHYGIAKLASSEAHINPLKKNRSAVENLAAFGTTVGPRYKKFLVDHLAVNGLTNMLLADLNSYGTPIEFVSRFDDYTAQLYRLVAASEPVIRSAVLYHAEMEWAGAYEAFHRPASVLARHQISYDVIPADVFSEPQRYMTNVSDGLVINGHRYESLIIPGCRYLPDSVADFILQSKGTGFPVFITNMAPENALPSGRKLDFCSLVISDDELSEKIQNVGEPDILMEDAPWIRMSHREKDGKAIYFLHNESPADIWEGNVKLKADGTLFFTDLANGKSVCKEITTDENGFTNLTIRLEPLELLIISGQMILEDEVTDKYTETVFTAYFPYLDETEKCSYKGSFLVSAEKYGRIPEYHLNEQPKADILFEEQELASPENMYHRYGPDFFGKIRYRFRAVFDENVPKVLDLGLVSDNAVVYVNGKLAGMALYAPYRVSLNGLIKQGENEFVIDVFTATAAYPSGSYLGIPASAITGVAQTELSGAGIIGPVQFIM